MEEIRVERDTAKAANQAKSQFLANMSHELRTPLNAIVGCADLLKDSKLDEAQRTYQETIFISGQAMTGIIEDILDFSKIEAKKKNLECVPLNLKTIVEEATKISLTRLKEGSPVTLNCDYPADAEQHFLGDPTAIRQVLVNLIGNALKFTSKGYVKVSVSIGSPSSERMTPITFSVEDTGRGIPADALSRIFEHFYQVDFSTNREIGGTGLGLAITQSLVTLMGGKIEVTSKVGEGSCFTVTCELSATPEELRDDQAEVKETLPIVSSNGKEAFPLHVLVVDDNQVNRMLLLKMLEKLGVKCSEINNGKRAVDLILGDPKRFDLVFMDLQMPIMGGIEATGLIREQGKSIPIVALTAAALADDRKKCLDAGMNGFLTKPISFEALEKIFEELNVRSSSDTNPSEPKTQSGSL